MSGITFGWVIRPVPDDMPEEAKSTPTRAGQALMAANEHYIKAMRPHFDTLWISDHFQWAKPTVLEAITTLTYLAARHSGMRIGHLVLGQSYRNPALTAKMAANLQLLTGGKFILGIGAGWKEDEYKAYGYPYPSAGVRIAQLEEAVEIIRAMWTESPATFHGLYYNIEDAECQPQPAPPIPLLIGGSGEQKTLRIVAKYADWWNHNLCSAEEYAHKQQVLAERCREIGRNPGEIVLTYRGLINFTDGTTGNAKGGQNYVIEGTPDAVTRELEEFIKLGVKHFQLSFLDFPGTKWLETFIDKVLPRLRSET